MIFQRYLKTPSFNSLDGLPLPELLHLYLGAMLSSKDSLQTQNLKAYFTMLIASLQGSIFTAAGIFDAVRSTKLNRRYEVMRRSPKFAKGPGTPSWTIWSYHGRDRYWNVRYRPLILHTQIAIKWRIRTNFSFSRWSTCLRRRIILSQLT